MHRLFLLGLLVGLPAASGGRDGPVVTEAEFLSVLDKTHPAVRESAAAVEVAEARVVAARTFSNPVLEASREEPRGAARQTDVLVSWKIPDARRRPRIEAREGDVQAARRLLAHQLLAHRLAMKQVWAAWAAAHSREERLATHAARLGTLAEREADRAAAGEASGLEALRLELAAATLRSRVAVAGAASERARAEAASWHPGLPEAARPVLPRVPPPPPEDGVDTRVQAARSAVAAAELARAATRPIFASPSVRFGWQHQEASPGTADGPVVGLAWSVPLFDRQQAARRSADASVETARSRLELAERDLAAARVAARNNFARLSTALRNAEGSLEDGSAMLDGAEAAFRAGESSLTDLLETYRSVSEAELAVLDLHEAALAAHRDLERVSAPLEDVRELQESRPEMGDGR